VRKLAALILISFVGLIVIALISIAAYFAHRTELVAQELTLFVNHTLATRSDVPGRVPRRPRQPVPARPAHRTPGRIRARGWDAAARGAVDRARLLAVRVDARQGSRRDHRRIAHRARGAHRGRALAPADVEDFGHAR
jgi:hypothetical protein